MYPSLEAGGLDPRAILDSIAEGVYAVDRRGRATFVNPAAGRLLGWSPSELVGRATHEIVHHSHADGSRYPKERCTMYRALSEGAVRHVDDEVFWRRDGSSFPVAYTTTPIRRAGHVIGAVITFHDISERRAAENRLIESESRFRTLTDHAPVGIFQTDIEGRCVFVNNRWAEIAGIPIDQARGFHWAQALHPDDADRVLAEWRATIASGNGGSSEHRLRGRKEDSEVWVVRQTVALRDDAGRVSGFIGTVTDVTAHRRDRIEARTDPLTGLPNRRGFMEELELQITVSGRHRRPLSLLMLDLDHFKEVNDRYGHPVGDEVLRETSRRLGGVVRAGEMFARVGGEEFAILLPGAEFGAARRAAERARAAIGRAPFMEVGRRTVSVGVAALVPGDSALDLLQRADGALYRAKSAGRDRVAE